MTDIAAAIGCEQLKKLDMFTAVRKRNANLLREGLQGIPGVVLPQGENHVFHQFTVRVKNRDEVITTPFSFIATANAIKMVGATPVFVDVEEGTYNINPDLIEQAITHKTKTILPVHLFGLPANMERIQDIATKHGVTVIEDACQAHNASFNGK